MSAPEGIKWGSEVGGYGRIGIYVKLTTTNTKVTREVQIWFWSKYSVSDTSNTFYYDCGTGVTEATTSKGSVSINTSNDSGSGWSTNNQKKISSATYEYTRGTSSTTYKIYAKLAGVDRVGGTMYANTSYTIPALDTYTVSYNANGGSGAPASQTKTYGKTLTLSSTKPTKSGYKFSHWNTKSDGSGTTYASGGNYTANAGVTLYAIYSNDTYTVSYNANGGSGAPSAQVKTHGKTLTLSSTKPTRTGYTFQGWATSASGSVAYSPGGSYTNNASVTLYAVWKANTYTVTYNANGGSGAPGVQTKTHGTDLTLSAQRPTKPNYLFAGWSTSASATTATYSAGGKYTNNASVTLYAVWTLDYTEPIITDLIIDRCDSDGTLNEQGANVLITFEWETDQEASGVRVVWIDSSDAPVDTVQSFSVSGNAGSFSEIIGDDELSIELAYQFDITVIDSLGSTTETKVVPAFKFPIDMKAGGRGVSIGKPAEHDDLFDVNFPILLRNGFTQMVLDDGADFDDFTLPNTYTLANCSSAGYLNCPFESGTGTLIVEECGDEGQIHQIAKVANKTNPLVYERFYFQGAWGDWIATQTKTQKLLWSGTLYMQNTHTATLSEPVSNQEHGIVLTFFAYDPDTETASNSDQFSFFVPKSRAIGGGHIFPMNTPDYSKIGTKRLLIDDTTLKGHANNTANGTKNGITFNNKNFVLRYVYGV